MLTSLDYAKLIQFTAQKMQHTMLNKTQINKILFYVYGVYLAEVGQPLFENEKPQAWPFGPVFPIVNKRINIDELVKFSEEKIKAYKENENALKLVVDAVKHMHNRTAVQLTYWSHQEGSPWHKTLYEGCNPGTQKQWSTVISDDYIKEYFANKENRIN
jgi:uncharacterized phage-associated protein